MDARETLLARGAVSFPPHEGREWESWISSAQEAIDRRAWSWTRWTDEQRRAEYSLDDLWININDVPSSQIGELPRGEARQLVEGVLGEDMSFPLAQISALLPGYPNGAPGIGRDQFGFLSQGNLHLDGSGTGSPAALIVGVLVSLVRAGVGSGQPLYVPGSHRRVARALKSITGSPGFADGEMSTRQIRSTVEQVRFGGGETHAIYGAPGTTYVYHGALVHGMAPNTAIWPCRRDAIYFRFSYSRSDPKSPHRFLNAVLSGWELPGLDSVAD